MAGVNNHFPATPDELDPTTTTGPATLQQLLSAAQWLQLPRAVRARFAAHDSVDYCGVFETVRASRIGWCLAQLARLLGTPILPWTGSNIAARVRVVATSRGVDWIRIYRRAGGNETAVHSTKTITADMQLVERLPARLCMPLSVQVRAGELHFVSHGYFFDVGIRIPLPHIFSPGVTHVIHRDEGAGWFRFTMIVTHPWLGELFYQTGRFQAAKART